MFVITFGLLLIGAIFRLNDINFGLPHSLYADEPEIAEFAIKYTYELRNIVGNDKYYELIPVSFVYGTFPTYVFTIVTMFYSKFSNLLNISFDKEDIYVFLRTTNALLTLAVIPLTALLYKNVFKKRMGIYISLFLAALNWKLIVHAHYLNQDIILTLCLLGAYIAMVHYNNKQNDTLYTVVAGLLFGLAVGTKVTALLTLPVFLYLYFVKKDLKGAIAFVCLTYGAFILTNPFSVAFFDDFLFRVYTLSVKENGLVFDSVDSDVFKYVRALFLITTPLVALFSLFGIAKILKRGIAKTNSTHLFLLLHIVIYLVFYSTGSRRVDRWLLPILPIMFVYAAYGISYSYSKLSKLWALMLTVLLLGSYLYFPMLLLVQFQRNTPKSASYIWAKDNLEPGANKYAVTEEGLDPLNKLQSTTVYHYKVYSNEGASLSYPQDPLGYHYIIISSRPMTNFKRPEVKQAYPNYVGRWEEFEQIITDPTKFELIKSFELPKPNLVPLSDVLIYKNLNPIEPII